MLQPVDVILGRVQLYGVVHRGKVRYLNVELKMIEP